MRGSTEELPVTFRLGGLGQPVPLWCSHPVTKELLPHTPARSFGHVIPEAWGAAALAEASRGLKELGWQDSLKVGGGVSTY